MLSVLVATVSTIGVFIRMRTSSLHEIQLRLAALEDMLASRWYDCLTRRNKHFTTEVTEVTEAPEP